MKRTPIAAAATAVAAVLVAAVGGAAIGQTGRAPHATVHPVVGMDGVMPLGHGGGHVWPEASASPKATSTSTPQPVTHPLSPAVCRARYGLPCYGAGQLARTYSLGRLRRHGLTGTGTEVGLVMPWHDPRLEEAVTAYSREYGLGAPRLAYDRPYGPVADTDPSDPMGLACAVEEELDVEMIRTTAPGAKIRVIEVPGDWAGTSNMGTAASAAVWAARRYPRLAAISMSYAWGEQNYSEHGGGGIGRLRSQDATLRRAADAGVTLLAADGDSGPTMGNLAETAYYPYRSVAFPASSPSVTAVSGTELHVRDSGVRRARDTVWGDASGKGAATGGGRSAVFARPAWQPASLGTRRSVGDISLVASDRTRVWFYTPYPGALAGQAPGWDRVAGTSLSGPLLAGLVADATQRAGHRLGNINPRLARLHGARDGILDVTSGSNTANGVTGFRAQPGPDAPSGAGTVRDALAFTRALVR